MNDETFWNEQIKNFCKKIYAKKYTKKKINYIQSNKKNNTTEEQNRIIAPPNNNQKIIINNKKIYQSIQKNKYGKIHIIDLHGLSQDAAHDTTQQSIITNYNTQNIILMFITGHGTEDNPGIIKELFPGWIEQLSTYILYFSPVYNKTNYKIGAFYVLLRKKRL